MTTVTKPILLDETGKAILEQLERISGSGGSNSEESLTAIVTTTTYSQLKAIRDNAQLVPGTWYRLTDYMCTTTQMNTRAVNHPFDLLILALDTNVLCEEARACLHEGDTYFINSHLEAWKVWYCIDNDSERFGWAASNGKGVIYRMIDEHRNDVPYDFKNIQFKRWRGEDDSDYGSLGSINETYCLANPNNRPEDMLCVSTSDYVWMYTFSVCTDGMELSDMSKSSTIYDETVFIANHRVNNDEGLSEECRDNIIKPYYGGTEFLPDIAYQGQTQFLNNNTFLLACEDNGDGTYYSDYAYGCYGNTFGVDSHDNFFGSGSYFNSIGSSFGSNSIGSWFNNNSIGSWFNNNSIGSDFYYNSIGSYFRYNSIGSGFNNNSIGSWFNNNSIGSNCYYNSIGSNCHYNSIGSGFGSNSIGSWFNNNSIGSDFYSNSIGSYFRYNSIGNYVRYVTVNDGVTYINLTGGSSSSNYVQNCQLFNGLQGVSYSNRLKVTFQTNKKFTQFAALKSDNTLDIWTR